MTSRVLVFDRHTLNPLTTLEVSATYSWNLNDVGRCEFTLATSDEKCKESFLQFGNLLYVEHLPTLQADEVTLNGKLPSWVGVIWPPQDWSTGLVAVTAYSGEYLLKKRPMPLSPLVGTPAAMFSGILDYANSWKKALYKINKGIVDDKTSAGFSDDLSTSALDHLQNLHGMTGGDFLVYGTIMGDNRLNILCDWRMPLGVDTGQLFSSLNSEPGEPILSIQGEPNTVLEAYSDSSAESNRVNFEATDEAAYGEYGFFAENISYSGITDLGVLSVVAQQDVKNNSRPVKIYDLTALDIQDTFAWLSLGNIWNIRIKSAGFMKDGSIGSDGKVRITSMEYSDVDNKVALSLEAI